MSAKIYSGIEGIEVPKLSFSDVPKYRKEVDEYIEKLRKVCKQNSKDEHVGEIIKFQVADGYAEYMVYSMKPLELIHIATWDEWEHELANLLTPTKVRELVAKERKMKELFSK